MRLFRTEVRDARYVSKRAPYKCLRCLCQYALGAACWLPTLMAMLAEYQHWFDGIVVNGTESFEGAIEGGFSLYTREIAGSIRPNHFPDLASLLIGKVHKTGGPHGPE